MDKIVKYRLTSFFALFFFMVISVSAQHTSVESALEKIANYGDNHPKEKVHLHLDKPYYSVGDDIWLKAYVTIGQFNYLSGLSKILYVDLIDAQESIVQSLRLPLILGLSMGDFQLIDSLKEGNYRIRAYTNWMRNFDPDLFYDHTFMVGNTRSDKVITQSSFNYSQNSSNHTVNTTIDFYDPEGLPLKQLNINYEVELEGSNIDRGRGKTDENGQFSFSFVNKRPANLKKGKINLTIRTPEDHIFKKTIPIKSTTAANSTQFFPESGQLIAGRISKIAFKSIQTNGLGIAAKGHIEDETGVHVASFESSFSGMGNFSFAAETGKNYVAKITYEDGTESEEALPAVQTSGYALTVNNELDKTIYIQAYTSEDLKNNQHVTLILQRNGTIFHAAKSTFSKSEILFSIPRAVLPPGVIQATLFSSDMLPLAERTLFNNNTAFFLPLDISTDKPTYQQKEKVSVKIQSGDTTDSIKVASLSAAVIDMQKVQLEIQQENSIYASLLLNSEIKGYIEHPSYYFEDADIAKKRQLDNLMLTQGWSNTHWQELLSGQISESTYQPEQDLRISGIITKPNGKTPIPNAKVTLVPANNFLSAIDTLTGADGRFSFDRLIFHDSMKFLVQARDEKGKKNLEIILDETPNHVITQNKNTPDFVVDVNQTISGYLKNTSKQFAEMERFGLKEKTILLEEVVVTRSSIREKLKHSDNLNGPGNADQVLTVDDLKTCTSLAMCLQGRLTGVMFKNGVPYSTRSPNVPMLIVMDGMYMEGGEALSMIVPEDVESIEVLRSVGYIAMYGTQGGGGVIVITTKRGGAPINRGQYASGILTHNPHGYHGIREFYSPDYSVADSITTMKDLRTTIHWAPDILTNEQGESSFEFYTAEDPGTYRIVLEGIDASGRIGRKVHYITVK